MKNNIEKQIMSIEEMKALIKEDLKFGGQFEGINWSEEEYDFLVLASGGVLDKNTYTRPFRQDKNTKTVCGTLDKNTHYHYRRSKK